MEDATYKKYYADDKMIIELRHEGLGKYRRITCNLYKPLARDDAENKAQAQLEAWDRVWQKELRKAEAARLTEEAREGLDGIDSVLQSMIGSKVKFSWDELKDTTPFPVPKPRMDPLVSPPPPPNESAAEYYWRTYRRFDLLSFLVASRRDKLNAAATEKAQAKLSLDKAAWEAEKRAAEEANIRIESENAHKVQQWESQKIAYEAQQAEKNKAVDELRQEFETRKTTAVASYFEHVARKCDSLDFFSSETDAEYKEDTRVLVIDYSLPCPDDMPTLKEVKYVASRDELTETGVSEKEANERYDRLLYQLCLGLLYKLFKADDLDMLASIGLNGWVKGIDRTTGQEINPCVLSVHISKQDFQSVDLSKVDPKACFKSLGGVGSSKLHGLAAIAPLLRIDRADSRFIEGYGVADTLDDTVNVAAIDWQDFEHLIREVFEKEFSSSGGEVKITRASRDRGVDAVAFDPDPIRGGKIVIQAKRYTATVGVDAVRDLYGTVINEGATKGILITTSDYGPDSYDFAKDKPLTLLNGSNLLYLLAKHGHKAKIDLKEAKKLLNEL